MMTPQAPSPSSKHELPSREPVSASPEGSKRTRAGGSIKSSARLQQAVVSALCLIVGYAAMYSILVLGVFRSTILEDPFLSGVVGDILVQLVCGIPALLPAAFGVAAWVLRVQKRRKLSERRARRMNAIASFILGAVAFVPCQFLFLMGAAL